MIQRFGILKLLMMTGKSTIQRPNNLNVDLGVTSAGASRIAFGLISLSDFMLDLELICITSRWLW